jgi:acetyl-CoA carboxylase carboxyltransferase component
MDLNKSLQQLLRSKRQKALQMGGPDKIYKQHAKGRLNARERINRLLDSGSFFEMGILAHSAVADMEERTPPDVVICG